MLTRWRQIVRHQPGGARRALDFIVDGAARLGVAAHAIEEGAGVALDAGAIVHCAIQQCIHVLQRLLEIIE